MKISKVLMAFSLAIAVLISQIGVVVAAPAKELTVITGKITEITLETDVTTAVTTVLVTIVDENNASQTFRLSLETAKDKTLRLIITDENGTPKINHQALGSTIQINPKTVISDDEAHRHPVADALATYFSDIIDYDAIMQLHEENIGLDKKGVGFGVIAQALWLTQKWISLVPDADPNLVFSAILLAKETGNFSGFVFTNGATPQNWEQFRKTILEGEKKGTLGMVMSNKEKDKINNGGGQSNGNNDNGNQDKDKNKDKGNNGNEQGNNNNDKDNGKGNNK